MRDLDNDRNSCDPLHYTYPLFSFTEVLKDVPKKDSDWELNEFPIL